MNDTVKLDGSLGEPKIVTSKIFVIDSAQELKLDIGKKFDSKHKIGEREIVVSKNILEQLDI